MKTSRNFLLQLGTSSWVVTRHISLLLLLVIVYLFVIFGNQQGIDIISAVISSGSYSFWTVISVLVFNFSLWFCANFLLQMKQISFDSAFVKKNIDGINFLVKNLPLLVGVTPTIGLLFKSEFYTKEKIWFVLILFLFAIILPILFRKNTSFLKKTFRNIQWFNEINLERQSLSALLYFKSTRIAFGLFAFVISGLFMLSLTSTTTGFAVYIGPFAVFNFGLSFFSVVVSFIMYMNIPGRRPYVIVFAILYLLFSLWNDNSEIRTKPLKNKRRNLEADFKLWVNGAVRDTLVSRQGATAIDSTRADTVYTIPVILVAAEGGGIRALYWTSLILDRLEKMYPEMYRNVYAISGVSGGGVGATFYISYLHDRLKRNEGPTYGDDGFRKSVGQDFLSDLLSAYLFQDNLQNFIPLPIVSFNRSRSLEDSWSKSYLLNNDSNTFEKSFTDLYNDSTVQLPRLFINGVLAESGQKTIVCYPTISGDQENIFRDDLDVITSINKDIPVKTVASLCSRFPYLTSGGLIKAFGGRSIGHVVDGGYKENTGLETVWQIMLRLKPLWQEYNMQKEGVSRKGSLIRFQPIVVFIKNSMSAETKGITPANFLHEVKIPFLGFSRTADRRTQIIDALTRDVFEDYIDKERLLNTSLYFKIDLDRKSANGKRLPLGWYFSNESFQFVDSASAKFLNDTTSSAKLLHLELRKYFKSPK